MLGEPRAKGEEGDESDTAPEATEAAPQPDPADDEQLGGANVGEGGDDPDLLAQVADTVGDLWDDPPKQESR